MTAHPNRPRIAVTHDPDYQVDAYLRAIELAGGEPVAVTAADAPTMDRFDGLVISGGVDLNPALYGEAPHPQTQAPDDDRDRMELKLLREALGADKPVLGICRGCQLFNVAHGGSLQQHIEDHRQPPGPKERPAHQAHVQQGSLLEKLLGSESVAVNSRHHQALATLGEGLTLTAAAPDGTVEAVELPGRRFAVAVQWHPENMAETDRAQMRLFEGFIEAARAAGN